jgi:hypothetical protein
VIGLDEDAVAESETVVDEGFARWRAGLDDMFALVAGRFARADSRARARRYVSGLLSGVERKNSWSLAVTAHFERIRNPPPLPYPPKGIRERENASYHCGALARFSRSLIAEPLILQRLSHFALVE